MKTMIMRYARRLARRLTGDLDLDREVRRLQQELVNLTRAHGRVCEERARLDQELLRVQAERDAAGEVARRELRDRLIDDGASQLSTVLGRASLGETPGRRWEGAILAAGAMRKALAGAQAENGELHQRWDELRALRKEHDALTKERDRLRAALAADGRPGPCAVPDCTSEEPLPHDFHESAVPVRHIAHIKVHKESLRRGGSCRIAVCICGWHGPQRATLEMAADDALIHEGGDGLKFQAVRRACPQSTQQWVVMVEKIKRVADREKARADELERKKANVIADWKRMEGERDRALAAVRAATAKRDDVWFWQGQGDHPESLSCPVVMSADTLREMLARADAAEAILQDLANLPYPMGGGRQSLRERARAHLAVGTPLGTAPGGKVEDTWRLPLGEEAKGG